MLRGHSSASQPNTDHYRDTVDTTKNREQFLAILADLTCLPFAVLLLGFHKGGPKGSPKRKKETE